jgi:hypothetical protein
MSILRRLFGSQRNSGSRPPPTIRELLIARTPPWDRVSNEFIQLVVHVLDDKELLDVFVKHSMEHGLIARYADICEGDFSAPVIRAEISQILCEAGNRALPALEKAVKSGHRDTSIKALMLCGDCFETAIAFDRTQVGGYIGLAHAYATIGRRDKSREQAKLGLSLLAELRDDPPSKALARGESRIFPPDIFDQMDRQLRT